jgi:simple sugar transport system substrate-binding protein
MNIMKKVAAVAATLLAGTAMAANIAVIAGSEQDGFFNLIKKGVDDATLSVKANGGKVNYMRTKNYDNFGPDLANLINTAVSQGVQGIAIPVWVPESEVPALQAAAKKGIKIMMYNAGSEHRESVNGLNYFGSDEYVAGLAAGEYMVKHGAKKILCHIQTPGAVNLESRCKGVTEGAQKAGGAAVTLRVPANLDGNQAATAEAIKAELLKDSAIDAVVNLAAWKKIKLGTFDLSPAVANRIKSGDLTMAIDQQPYLQGFLATSMLAAHIDFGTNISTVPVLTGPNIVDASNIEAALEGIKKGAR